MSASTTAGMLHDAPVVKRRARRRLLDRINRISSSPQLTDLAEAEYSPRNSVSCISLATGSRSGGSSHNSSGVHPVRFAGKDVSNKKTTPTAAVPKAVHQQYRVVSQNFLEVLPGEICLQILSYLEPKELVRCSMVNKALGRLCFDGQLWSVLDTRSYYKDIPAHQLTKLITVSGSFIRYLNLRGCVQLQNDFHAITTTCNNLLSASLEGCSLSRPTVHRLIVNNNFLIHLNISGLEAVSNLTCRNIAESCSSLRTLDISFCPNMDGRGIRKVVGACTKLTDLRAAECQGIDDEATLETIFKTNKLEKLLLGGCEGLMDESIRIMVEGIEPDIDPLTDRTTAPPRKLKQLNLSRCRGLTDTALKHLAHNVPDLEGLELGQVSNLTDEGLIELLPTVPKLTHLDLEECSNITNDAMIGLAKADCSKTLRHLQISFCENVSDEGMIPLIKSCSALRNVELDNTRITDSFLTEAATAVRQRASNTSNSRKPKVGLRMVCFDCVNINWTGIQSVLAANSTHKSEPRTSATKEVIHLKCYYGWQQTVDQHLKLVLRGDFASAKWLEDRWADHMSSSEDSTLGSRRRRRRAREAALLDIDADGNENRRRRRTGGCAIM